MASMPFKFINGKEGQRLFAEKGGMDLSSYPHQEYLKSWVGAMYGVYQYEGDRVNPVLLDKFRLVNMEVRRQGAFGLLVSLITGDVMEITNIPAKLRCYPIYLGFPQRTYFEKTIQNFGDESGDDLAFGLSACLQTYHVKRSGSVVERIPFFTQWSVVRELFTDGGAFIRAADELKKKVNLV